MMAAVSSLSGPSSSDDVVWSMASSARRVARLCGMLPARCVAASSRPSIAPALASPTLFFFLGMAVWLCPEFCWCYQLGVLSVARALGGSCGSNLESLRLEGP